MTSSSIHRTIFAKGLNRMVARVMRHMQLTDGKRRNHLRRAKYWLEMARKALRAGDTWLAYHHASFAHEWIQDARKA